MSKKSIGQFIAALRKANGMTQKQLGEKLNVSDKAISRWERDECAPDLSLIPVIAEIFSVTSDEILRGERIIINNGDGEETKNTGKTEKQIAHLLNDTETKFSIRSAVSVTISVVGILSAMIANFGFNRAYIGFFISCIFFIIALLCESIVVKLTFSAIDGINLEISDNANSFKRKIFKKTCNTYAVICIIFATTLPLAYIPFDTFMGITASTCLLHGLLCAVITFILSIFVIWIAKWIAFKKKIYILSDTESFEYAKINKLKIRQSIIALVILFITFIAQCTFNNCVYSSNFSQGTVFVDMDKFKEYMETDIPYGNINTESMITEYATGENGIDGNISAINGNDEYKDIAEETIEDLNGNIICRFNKKNESVVQYDLDFKDGKPIITAYTNIDLEYGNKIIDKINIVWLVAYGLEIVCFVVSYIKKRNKV
ncbi:MAG: helix-turn-helix domain-containing protein [Faecalibacterium sp.]|nr:helix-turn-helix domain-containing protein [Ruminococcus sp.]MCM1393264.1 helix-turn-helix domain-containing protein [Ruminococcus sp.]MCM1486588.1 helix-turn-helix domain-containing protein [Faecalibacterium sp.]